MHFHLAISGLIWPSISLSAATQGLVLPGIGRLAARGSIRTHPPISLERWLAAQFDLATAPPFAALRLLGAGGNPGDRAWMCVDPVHCRFVRDTIVIGSADEAQLTMAEAETFVDTLNQTLSELGIFSVQNENQWLLELKQLPSVTLHPLDDVRGRQLAAFLPQGEEGRTWRHMLNEVQTILHAHPLNAKREARKQAAVNSVWFWGAGALPDGLSSPTFSLFTNNTIAQGLARWAKRPAANLPERFDRSMLAAQNTDILVVLDTPALPAQQRDAHAWQTAVSTIDQNWIIPTVDALRRGQISTLTVSAFGDENMIEYSATRSDTWRLWRYPRPAHIALAGTH